MKRTILMLAMSCLLAASMFGCSDPKEYKVKSLTENQKKEIVQKLGTDGQAKIAGWMIRNVMMGNNPPDDTTVGQAIKDQDEWLAKQAIEEAHAVELKKKADAEAIELKKQADAMKEKAEAERKAKLEEISGLVSVALIAKKNKSHEYGQKFVYLEMAFENKSNKDVQGIKGVLTITDIFGDKIKSLAWSYDKGINAKQKAIEVDHGADINQFKREDQKLWDTDFDKLKSSFEVSTIIFKDGTKIDAPQAMQN